MPQEQGGAAGHLVIQIRTVLNLVVSTGFVLAVSEVDWLFPSQISELRSVSWFSIS